MPKATFNRLRRLQIIDRNPIEHVRPLKETKRKRAVLGREEANRLLECCEEPLRMLVLAGFLTGARASELTSPKWGDIDFARETISLYRSKTKTADFVPLHPTLGAELKRVKAERMRRGKRIVGDREPVFRTKFGTPYRYYRRAWSAAVKRAGLGDREGLVFHSLRHSFATAYLENGAAITDLKGILGHHDITTTQIYARMVNKRAKDSLRALGFGT